MSRDEILHTGMTSASRAVRLKANEEKIDKQVKLKPSAKVVLEAIETEKQNILNLRSLIFDMGTEEEDLKSELLARKKYFNYLTQLQAVMNQILAAKPIKKTEAEKQDA